MNLAQKPAIGSEWRQAFLDFVRNRVMSKSYKPVMLKALFKVIDRNGVALMSDLVREFLAFYVERERRGLVPEIGNSVVNQGTHASFSEIKSLIIKNPLDRFIIQGFLEYDEHADLIRFNPQLWHELRFYEWLDILTALDEQIAYYYQRNSPNV